MKAAVLSIGTELTRGELVNGNAAWLGDRLTSVGFDVIEHRTVGDDLERIAGALRRLAAEVRVLVASGGLGPTTDDLTTRAVASCLGVALRRDEPTLQRLRAKWAAMGLDMPASNEKQADFPEGAEILPNPVGTAPGFTVAIGGARMFFLPGVPREMRHLFDESVVPSVAPLVERTTHQIHIRTFGMTESQVGDLLADLDDPEAGILIGYRASFPEIEVKVLARADTEVEAEDRARRVAEEVRRRLGDTAYGERDDTFPAAVGRALRDRGLTVALAESCTGGLVGSMLTSVAGSSDYVLMDAVTYANSAKSKMLGVSQDLLRAHGAVSAEVAEAMAEGALRMSGADLAVSITGIAGPGGGSEGKPVGTVWFGLARKGEPTVTKLRTLRGDRERIRVLSAYVALKLVLRAAKGDVG
ncbi:MAG: competence/damage-inducible protein A [Myxococcota bacterium]